MRKLQLGAVEQVEQLSPRHHFLAEEEEEEEDDEADDADPIIFTKEYNLGGNLLRIRVCDVQWTQQPLLADHRMRRKSPHIAFPCIRDCRGRMPISLSKGRPVPRKLDRMHVFFQKWLQEGPAGADDHVSHTLGGWSGKH